MSSETMKENAYEFIVAAGGAVTMLDGHQRRLAVLERLTGIEDPVQEFDGEERRCIAARLVEHERRLQILERLEGRSFRKGQERGNEASS